MADRTFRATFSVEVEITVPDVAISRVLNNEDGWRDQFYNLFTEREVVEHLARNMGVQGNALQALDGWADLRKGTSVWSGYAGRITDAQMDEYSEVRPENGVEGR